MAADISNFYRNYDLNDSTYENMSAVVAPDPSTLWEVQAGRSFIEWNTARDGTGASYAIGDYLFGVTLYAIWTPIIKYSTNNVELTSIANAIREKGGTSAQLVYPTGFVSAIQAINTGGGETTNNDAFIENEVTSNFINSTASKIRTGLFAYCDGLKSIQFASCTTIGNYAFYNCSKLTDISFPSCTSIGSYAFYFCSKLTSALFPACTTIGSYTFYNCYSLTDISFPVCTSIGGSAFYDCYNIINVSFPVCISIGGSAFYNCSNITNISFPTCTTIGNYAFYNCSNITNISFPTCTTIGNYAFYRCFKLSVAHFSVCSLIRSSAFLSCRNLLSLTINTESLCTLQNSNAFNSSPIAGYTTSTNGEYGSIYVPASLVDTYKSAANWSYYSSRIFAIES